MINIYKQLNIFQLNIELKKNTFFQLEKDQLKMMGLNFDEFAAVWNTETDDSCLYLFHIDGKFKVQYDFFYQSSEDCYEERQETFTFIDLDQAIFFLNQSGIAFDTLKMLLGG